VPEFTKYVEAYPIKEQSAEGCARVYASQIITRHDTGSKLITDQGSTFMSAFFSETVKILGIRKVHTSSYHPQANSSVERFHRSLHTGLAHYVDATNTNWDLFVPFYLMAYRATPNTTTGYNPLYLLHGREMILLSSDNLKAKIAMDNPNHQQRLESLKESLRTVYEAVGQANKNSHQNNKRLYDRRAKLREFKEGVLVYLFTPAKKLRLSKKFRPKWSGPYKIVKKISELNYEVAGSNDKRQIVHVNRLKAAHDPSVWKPKPRC